MRLHKNKPLYIRLTPMKMKFSHDGDIDMFCYEYVEDGKGKIYKMELTDEITQV